MNKLHIGCGNRKYSGWLNVDREVDLTRPLPYADRQFHTILGQHVLEHFDLFPTGMSLLAELRRVLEPNGTLWLAVPDMEKICAAYMKGKLQELLEAKQKRINYFKLPVNCPISHLVNIYFYAGGHRTMFDCNLLSWALSQTGFDIVQRRVEQDLLDFDANIYARMDDEHTLYVAAS